MSTTASKSTILDLRRTLSGALSALRSSREAITQLRRDLAAVARERDDLRRPADSPKLTLSHLPLYGGLCLDLVTLLGDGTRPRLVLHHPDVVEHLAEVEAAGDPLHLVEQLRSMLNNRATTAQDAPAQRTA